MDESQLHMDVLAMIARAEGQPAVHVGGSDGAVFICRRLSQLRFDDDHCFYGECDWVDPPEARPDELTDGIAISFPDCLSVGPGWFHDAYFDWYFVYDPPRVARSLAGDHTWVPSFLASPNDLYTEPGTAD